MVSKFAPPCDLLNVLAKTANGATPSTYPDGEVFFVQGDAADAVFYIQHGRVKKTYVSRHGKERVVAILNAGEFFGGRAGRTKRMMTAAAMTACSVARYSVPSCPFALRRTGKLAETFINPDRKEIATTRRTW
jgi:CRP-like cAMP-binding protein